MATLREECETKGIRLESAIDQAESQSWADLDALGHLAEILLRNALYATPSGGRIHVRSRSQGSGLEWSISDTGKGISAAEGAHLFDPFYCGRQAGRGLGLGLPRAARIAALAGGSLHWASAPGQGTTFQVRLPLDSLPEAINSEAAQVHSAVAQTVSQLGN
jgi:signal transduction histidine kinase